MKKLMILAVVVFAFALTANATFAFCGMCGWKPCPCPEITVNSANNAKVFNTVKTTAVSGDNFIKGGMFSASKIWAGSSSVEAGVTNQAGYNEVQIANPANKTTVNSYNNATVFNTAKTTAVSGDNAIIGGGFSKIGSGSSYAGASVMNIVGSNVTKIGCANCQVSD